MADRHEPEDPALAVAARHALHDEELVAAFGGGSADDAESARAQALVGRCTTCAALARDIEAITGAVRSADDAAAASAYVKAPRDFRLTTDEAARLRPAALPAHVRPPGLLARLGAALSGGIAAYGRPMGATLATFGLVGLLVGTVSLSPSKAAPAALPLASVGAAPGFGAAENPPAGTGIPDQNELGPRATDSRGSAPIIAADEGVLGPGSLAWLFAGSVALLVLGVALLLAGFRGARGARSPTR